MTTEADLIRNKVEHIRAMSVTGIEKASSSVVNLLLDDILDYTSRLEKKAYMVISRPKFFPTRFWPKSNKGKNPYLTNLD